MLPREKLIKYGVKSLEEYELLAIILGFGSSDENVFELSKKIIDSVEGVSNLVDLSYEELINIKGIKSAKATKIIASIELAKRIFSYIPDNLILDNPKDIYRSLKYDLANIKHEEFIVLFLDKRVRLIKKSILAIGNNNFVSLDLKEIIKQAIKTGCSNLILVHNHPSDYLSASQADIETTKKIIDAAKVFDICVLDHIIISRSGYFSFLEEGLLLEIKSS